MTDSPAFNDVVALAEGKCGAEETEDSGGAAEQRVTIIQKRQGNLRDQATQPTAARGAAGIGIISEGKGPST